MSKISILSFSERKKGNCASLAHYISSRHRQEEVDYISVGDLKIKECINCNYACTNGKCMHYDDGKAYFESTKSAEKVLWLVPLYGGSPTSLLDKMNERSKEFWTKNDVYYNEFIKKLFIIGIGSTEEEDPFGHIFEPVYSKPPLDKHILMFDAWKSDLNSKWYQFNDANKVRKRVGKFLGI